MLNLLLHEVEFPDGHVKEYSANLIADDVLARVDSYGFSVTLFEAITGHCKDNACVDVANECVMTSKGMRRL